MKEIRQTSFCLFNEWWERETERDREMRIDLPKVAQLGGKAGIRMRMSNSNTWESFTPLLPPNVSKTHGFGGFYTDLFFLQMPQLPYLACPLPTRASLSPHSDDPLSFKRVLRAFLSGTCPYIKSEVGILTWGAIKDGKLVFTASPNLFSDFPIPINGHSSSSSQTPGLHSTLPSMHVSNSLLGYIEVDPKILSNLSLPSHLR